MKWPRALIAGVLAVLMMVGLMALPASAAKHDIKTSISASRKTCEVVATASWRMDAADELIIQIWSAAGGYNALVDEHVTPIDAHGRYSISYVGTPGQTYWAFASMYGSPGGSDRSPDLTLACRG